MILWSAPSAVPHWQLHARERTIFRCQSKAAKLAFPSPCAKATVDTEPDHHPQARKLGSNSTTKTNAGCAVPVNPASSFVSVPFTVPVYKTLLLKP